MRLLILILSLCAPMAAVAQDCTPRDLLSETLPPGPAMPATALLAAYPGLRIESDIVTAPFGPVGLRPPRGLTGVAALEDPTTGDMFAQIYPLGDGAAARLIPWFDPGRARDAVLFRFLWFDTESAARATIVPVTYPPTGAVFAVTTRWCAATQLAAALADLTALADPALDPWFTDVGGGFNWRFIAGTPRLSAHSFGTAIDLNADLGGYWRWDGAPEGAVGAWDSAMPAAIITAMERRGFIWGGKWHHYDGMHFEYRPELILFARMAAR